MIHMKETSKIKCIMRGSVTQACHRATMLDRDFVTVPFRSLGTREVPLAPQIFVPRKISFPSKKFAERPAHSLALRSASYNSYSGSYVRVPRGDFIKVVICDGKSSWMDFLSQFEMGSHANGWDSLALVEEDARMSMKEIRSGIGKSESSLHPSLKEHEKDLCSSFAA